MSAAQHDGLHGVAYELAPPQIKENLVRVGRGTPMGELLRRYWHPVGLSADAAATPKKVRALGEDLILPAGLLVEVVDEQDVHIRGDPNAVTLPDIRLTSIGRNHPASGIF